MIHVMMFFRWQRQWLGIRRSSPVGGSGTQPGLASGFLQFQMSAPVLANVRMGGSGSQPGLALGFFKISS